MAGTEYNNIIVTKDLIRTFKTMGGEVHACNRISIEVPEKQMTILRGRSGSGKTTLINMLGTLDRPTSGLISFDGQDITKMSDSQRDKLRRTKIGFCVSVCGADEQHDLLWKMWSLACVLPDILSKTGCSGQKTALLW